MKQLSFVFFLLCAFSAGAYSDTSQLNLIIMDWDNNVQIHWAQYHSTRQYLVDELKHTNLILADESLAILDYVKTLNRKVELIEKIKYEEEVLGVELTKLRYKKGLEIIRLLYEKVLGLDHHFSSLQTYQNITSLSNPNAYPEYQNSKAVLERQLKKENSLQLPLLLETNPYLSPAFSLITSVLGTGNKMQRENELDNISCILDFTARMNSELATIYYETEYLRESNVTLKEECVDLFEEYVEVVRYHTPLDVCRREDDWDKVYEALDTYITDLETEIAEDPHSSKAIKLQVELEFAVDRLINFINKYNAFIEQGAKYYQKFEVIISNYPNEEECKAKLPIEFDALKRDINYSIDRFNEAYDISALRGSKLKDLLYGFSE
ncbi:MAG: hypothetical protein MI974_14590 [Chitinophagales bacterium]|nr:hypothetical protein [Chitinophagales bacterium]